jgi:hypothetical protein
MNNIIMEFIDNKDVEGYDFIDSVGGKGYDVSFLH